MTETFVKPRRAAAPHAPVLLAMLLMPTLALFIPLSLSPLFGVAAVWHGVALLLRRERLIHPDRATVLFGVLLLWSGLSLTWTPRLAPSFEIWIGLFFQFLGGMVMLAAWRRFRPPVETPLLQAIVVGTWSAIVIAAIEVATHGFLVRHFHQAILGSDAFTLKDLDRGATVLAVAVWPCFLALRLLGRPRLALLTLLAALVLLASLKSISALAGLCMSVVVFAIACRGGTRFYRIVAALVILSACSVPAIFTHWLNPPPVVEKLPGLPRSSQHRLYIWEFVSNKAMEHPLTGWGVRSSKYIPGGSDIIPAFGDLQYLPLHPHNSVLQLWLELGIPGVLMFSALCWLMIRWMGRQPVDPQTRAACLAAMAAYVTIGLTAFGVWQYWWLSAAFLCAGAMAYLVRASITDASAT